MRGVELHALCGIARQRGIDELEKVTQAETKKIEELSAAKEREVMELK